jgi:hypothetical protein
MSLWGLNARTNIWVRLSQSCAGRLLRTAVTGTADIQQGTLGGYDEHPPSLHRGANAVHVPILSMAMGEFELTKACQC